MFQLGQCGPGMGQIRVGHRRVFALDIHAANGARGDSVHNFHHGETRRGIQFGIPQFFERRTNLIIIDRLVVGHDHGNQPGIRSPLNVVLPPQRMQAGARATGLAAGQRQRNQAPGVIGTVGVLGNAHAPENHCPLGVGIEPSHLANGLGLNAAQAAHRFGGHVDGMNFQGLEALGMLGDISRIIKFFTDDHIQHGIKEGHVGAR